jgi:hypothetical protein
MTSGGSRAVRSGGSTAMTSGSRRASADPGLREPPIEHGDADRCASFVGEFQRAWSPEGIEVHHSLWHERVELHQPLLGSLYERTACARVRQAVRARSRPDC